MSFDFSLMSSKLHLLANAGISFGMRVIPWNKAEIFSKRCYSSLTTPTRTHPRYSNNVDRTTHWNVMTRQVACVKTSSNLYVIEKRVSANEAHGVQKVDVEQRGEESSFHLARVQRRRGGYKVGRIKSWGSFCEWMAVSSVALFSLATSIHTTLDGALDTPRWPDHSIEAGCHRHTQRSCLWRSASTVLCSTRCTNLPTLAFGWSLLNT